jgi:quercetin dioxygenase-like cupin family protein
MSYTLREITENSPIAHFGPKSSCIVSGNDDVWFETIAGELMRIRIHARDVGGRFAILETIAQPMAGTPMHTHREDEVFQVLDGVLTFEIENQRIEAGAGAIVVVPAGAKHAWRNFGNEPARSIVTFAPGGIERMFTTLGDLALDELANHVARYGSMIHGPMIER